MASMLDKIAKFMRSPRGQQLVHEAQRRARDPRTREQLNRVVRKMQRRR